MFKLVILILSISTTFTLFSSVMIDDIGLSWGTKQKGVKIYLQKQLMKKYPNYYEATPERQDIIVKKVRKDITEILNNEVLFKEKSPKYDNSIYAGEYHYNNNESMLTLIKNGKTTRFFMINKYLWKIIFIIEKEKLGEKYNLSSFITHFSNKYNLEAYRIDYDKFNIDKKKPIKAYFKDQGTLLSLSYNDIYGSFILVYSSIKVMKKLKEKGFKVITSADIDLTVDMGAEVKEYDQMLYESDLTSDSDDGDTKDIFSEIDSDFNKDAKKSKVKKKERDAKYKKGKKKKQ